MLPVFREILNDPKEDVRVAINPAWVLAVEPGEGDTSYIVVSFGSGTKIVKVEGNLEYTIRALSLT